MWESERLGLAETVSHTFDEPEIYSCICEIHRGRMHATVVVEG